MSRYWYRFLQYLWGTWLGGKYLEFLLWKDEQNGSEPVVSHYEIHQIIIQAQQLLYKEGILEIKRKVGAVVNAKTKEEYEKALQNIEDLIPLARKEDDKHRELRAILHKSYIRKDKDIKNALDHAKMIDQRIEDYKELREHKKKRELLRSIREHRKLGNKETVQKLEQEFKKHYVENK